MCIFEYLHDQMSDAVNFLFRSKYVVGSANMTNVQLVALALCYCFSLYHIIDEWYDVVKSSVNCAVILKNRCSQAQASSYEWKTEGAYLAVRAPIFTARIGSGNKLNTNLMMMSGMHECRFAEGLYYLVFSFTTTILGGLLLGCHDYYENGSSH